MVDVKGSSQYRSIVVRYRPWQRVVLIVVIVLLLLAVAGGSAWWTRAHYTQLHKQLLAENHALNKQLPRVKQQRDVAEQQLANISTGADVDRAAVAGLQIELKNHQNKIAELTEEIGFYKGLMSPSERERGLSVRDMEILATAAEQVYQYKLVLQQTALKHRLLKGSVRVVLVGTAPNEQGMPSQRRYALADLSPELKTVDIPLRFKYFQNIEGELTLPVGFDVQKIELVARASSPKKVQIEQTYEWKVQAL
ncbi:DUF6776 family protein [Dasania marina]|uniref:DUF6776 family protein n=1 Tax=Dasania marina TaxID=471499 RepID=UPI0030D71E00|tara:strand:+ start:35552 stop:36307 length:756 start_codon:yes stop_codon:yes gene_type:complete